MIAAALGTFAARVRARCSDRVRELVLFGSQARGSANEDSDVDVLVVVDELSGAEGRELGHMAGDIFTEFDVVLSPFAVSSARMAELRARERLIAAEIARDGVAL